VKLERSSRFKPRVFPVSSVHRSSGRAREYGERGGQIFSGTGDER